MPAVGHGADTPDARHFAEGGAIEIRVRGYELTLRVEEAKKIEVEGVSA